MNQTKKPSVLVTGASRGIGKAIALTFASHGYRVAITCRKNEEKLYEVRDQIISMGTDCLTYVGDLGDYSFVQTMFKSIDSSFHGIDVLINNAGMSYIGLLTDMSPEEWNQILSTNLTSMFYCSKLAVPSMVHNKQGKIINISSVWGCVGASCEVAYSATKGAINSFTMALAKELAPSNIQVNALACGTIDTEMNAFLSDEDRISLEEEIPAGRFASPDEVGAIAYQLATSPTYLTGQVIRFDGGWI